MSKLFQKLQDLTDEELHEAAVIGLYAKREELLRGLFQAQQDLRAIQHTARQLEAEVKGAHRFVKIISESSQENPESEAP